ncbi:hypothetical protein ACWGI8_36695 [Streptomyces sp. NPDC054841]
MSSKPRPSGDAWPAFRADGAGLHAAVPDLTLRRDVEHGPGAEAVGSELPGAGLPEWRPRHR